MRMKATALRAPATVIGVMVALFAAMALSASLGASQAWAGAQPETPRLENLTAKSSYVVSFKDKGIDYGYRQYQSIKVPGRKISNVKSSNPKVATIQLDHHVYSGTHVYSINVTIKKAGTTKLSFKWGGKKYNIKYIVKKYTNPVKAFKIGSKDFASRFAPKALTHAGMYVSMGSKATSYNGKVQIQPAKGWKISKIWYWGNNKLRFIKNGGTVSKAQTLYVSIKRGTQHEILYVYAGGKNYRAA